MDKEMTHPIRVAAAFAVLAAVLQRANAADAPSDMIVGTWKVRNEVTNPQPNDSTMEFSKDGTGEFSKTEKGKREGAKTSWKITKSFGNACILVIEYPGAPEGVKPLTLLAAFDGKDTLVVQAKNSGVGFFDRQKQPGSGEN
jgi:hypothetical protein